MNYIISGRQASGKTTQAAALAGKNPLFLANGLEVDYLTPEHTSIVIDEINDIKMIHAIFKWIHLGCFFGNKYSREKKQFELPIILVTSLSIDVLSHVFEYFDSENMGVEFTMLITNQPNKTLKVSVYENS